MGKIHRWISDCLTTLKLSRLNHFLINPDGEVPVGQQAESQVAKYLRHQGLRLVTRNFSTQAGEVDLVMLDGEDWVFVEVKYRQNDDWAGAEESVNRHKQQRIIKAAAQFMQQNRSSNQSGRFDVVTVIGQGRDLRFNWIKHAFY